MTKLHELPNNDENYYRKAMNAFQINNYQLGLDYLSKSFDLEQDLDVFKELVDICISLDDKDRLRDLWLNYFPDPNSFYHETLLVELWLASVSFLYPLQEAINLLTQQLLDWQAKDQEASLMVQPVLSKLLSRQSQLTRIQKLSQAQYKDFIIEAYQESPLKLLEILKISYSDPNIQPAFYLTLLKELDILNFIKSDVLHYLINQGLDQRVLLAWSGQNRQVDLKQLQPYKDMENYREGLKAIQAYFSHHDPHLMGEAIQAYNLHYQVFYPFPDEVLPKQDSWLQAFLSINFNQDLGLVDPSLIDTVNQAQAEIQSLILDI